MSICLNMIVKNESKTLPRLFASIHPYISFYVISDTGSTDNTISTIRELGEKYKIGGMIYTDSWVNFAHNRNLALDYAMNAKDQGLHACKWLLIIDADDELMVDDQDFVSKMFSDKSYFVYKDSSGLCAKSLAFLSTDHRALKWKGEIHEYLESQLMHEKMDFLHGVHIRYHHFEGANSHPFANQQEKSLKEVQLFEKELMNETPSVRNLHRYFQAGNAYIETKQYEKAILHFEAVAAYSTNNTDYPYFALINLGNIFFYDFHDFERSKQYYLRALAVDEQRKEAYYYLAKIHQEEGNILISKELLEKADRIIIDSGSFTITDLNMTRWMIKFQLLTVYVSLKQTRQAADIIEILENNVYLPEPYVALLKSIKLRVLSEFDYYSQNPV